MKAKFINDSNSCILIDLVDLDEKIEIEPKSYSLAESNEINTFSVYEVSEQQSNFEKFLGVIISVIISIFLWFANYFDATSDSIEQTIKFDMKFYVDKELLVKENTIVIKESKTAYVAFDAFINDCEIKGSPIVTKEKLSNQIKSYRQSKLIIFIFPILILISLLILSFYINNVVMSVIVFCLAIFIFICEYKKGKKDKEKIKQLIQNLLIEK